MVFAIFEESFAGVISPETASATPERRKSASCGVFSLSKDLGAYGTEIVSQRVLAVGRAGAVAEHRCGSHGLCGLGLEVSGQQTPRTTREGGKSRLTCLRPGKIKPHAHGIPSHVPRA
jgi:hypothetical protein